jgi:hypothetical protein
MAAILPLPDERDRRIKGIPSPGEGAPISDAPLEVEELADGSAVASAPEEKKVDPGEFSANLVELLDQADLDAMAQEIEKKIEIDKQARSKRDEQYAEGLKRTGLDGEAPGGASFYGASRAAHPMLAEACVDFSASAMKELYPPSGPFRTEITGEQTQEKLAIAERQSEYVNWCINNKMEEYPDELAQTMTQLPMGGSAYMKFWPDYDERIVRSEFVPVDDVLLPFGVASFWSSPRITHIQRLTQDVWGTRIESGMYVDPGDGASSPTMLPEQSKSAEESQRIEGVEQPVENVDGLRIVYEVNTFWKLKVDKDKRLPYLISYDDTSKKIVSVYRNWKESDKRPARLHWMVDYGFIPWRGAYKLGLPQLIGGLSAAATGALRALLDAALANTIPTLAKLKTAKMGAQSKTLDAMNMIEIEAATTVTDIRQTMMSLPFNPPSPVLYQLLEWITQAGKNTISTATEKMAEIRHDAPVGTALALIEQKAKVFSAIHASLHRSQRKALKVITRIMAEFVDEREQIEEFGEVICTRDDLEKPLGVVPASDPNIFSESQRYAQMQIVDANVQKFPQLHNLYEVLKSTYRLAKIPDVDKILPPPREPQEMNAAAENAASMMGAPLMAFPEQNHVAHIETHIRFIADPLFGASPASVPQTYPRMVEHMKQHLSFLYAKVIHDLASQAVGNDIGPLMADKRNWPHLDGVIAAASKVAHDRLTQILAPLGPEIAKMVKQLELMKPPPPMDPSQSALQIASMEDRRAREEDERQKSLDAQKLAAQREKDRLAAANAARQTEIKGAEAIAKGASLAHEAELGAQEQAARLEGDAEARAQAADQQAHQQAMDLAGREAEERRGAQERGLARQQHDDAMAQQVADRQQADQHKAMDQEQARRQAEEKMRAEALRQTPGGHNS